MLFASTQIISYGRIGLWIPTLCPSRAGYANGSSLCTAWLLFVFLSCFITNCCLSRSMVKLICLKPLIRPLLRPTTQRCGSTRRRGLDWRRTNRKKQTNLLYVPNIFHYLMRALITFKSCCLTEFHFSLTKSSC